MVQSKVRAQGVSHAVLETCFITDQDDMDWYLVNKTKIAQAIIAGIQQGFGLNYKKAITPYMVKVDVAPSQITSSTSASSRPLTAQLLERSLKRCHSPSLMRRPALERQRGASSRVALAGSA